jgi:glycosyltransferase involved in cell wall biosynthesis
MPSGNGAYVVHKLLESRIPGYEVRGYDPRLTYFPPLLRRHADPRAELVHTTADHAVFVGTPGAPLVLTFHNFVLDPGMRPYSSLTQRLHYRYDLRWWTAKALTRAAAITAVSRFTADLLKQELGYQGRVRVIYNGVDTEAFRPRPSPRGEDGMIKVLFSGNLTRRKGADLLPRIADRLAPNVKILYTEGLRRHAQLAAHPRLECVGPVPFTAMPALYREADLLVTPSVREGFGLNAAEAMASGLPVVASDCSSLPELVEAGRGGLLCPVGEPDGFAAAINRLAESPALRREMGQFNRARAEKDFALPRMVAEYEALFAEVSAR